MNNGNSFTRHKLGDISESIEYGLTASANKEPVGPRFLRITDIQDDNVRWEDVPFCECPDADRERYELREGDIVFARTGATTGKSYLIRECPESAVFASYLIRVRPSSRVCPDFLSQFFRTPDYWSQISGAVNGSTQPGVNGTKLKELQVPIPPLPEQRRIAAILDKADAIRRKREEGIRLTEELLRSTFLDMFGDPATNPKGWEVKKLGDVISFIGGSQPPKETFISEEREGYIRLVQIRDFKTDKYKIFIPQDLARRRFESDDVMIARYGPPVFQILRGLAGSYNVALMKAQSTEKTIKDFIFYLLQTHYIHDIVVQNSSRTAGQTGVNLDLLNNLNIPIPPITVQKQISATMFRIERIKALREQECKDSGALFGSLVQRAFRGEL